MEELIKCISHSEHVTGFNEIVSACPEELHIRSIVVLFVLNIGLV